MDRLSPRRATSTTTSSKRAKRRPKPRKKRTRSTEAGIKPRTPAAGAGIAFLSLGSNRGDRRAHLTRALTELAALAPVLAVSSFYRSDPVGYTDQRPFWNAVAAIRWTGTPAALLAALKGVERRVGRTKSFRNGPREIDVDILDLSGKRRARPDPILPHPRLARRRFALAPLSEIAPRWRHPVTGRSASELLAALPERPAATRLSSRPRGYAARLPGSEAPRRDAGARESP